MDQSVVAGIGNVYRAELLYRHRVDPFRPGTSLRVGRWQAMWEDLVELMADGRPDRPDRHRAARAPHRRGARRHEAAPRSLLRLPPRRRAVPGLRDPGPDPGAAGPQPVLVCEVPAPVPVAGRTVTRDHVPDPDAAETPMTTDVQPSRARAGDVRPPRHTMRRFARRGAYQDTKVLIALVAARAGDRDRGRHRARRHAVHQPDGAAAARQPPAQPAAPAVVRHLRLRAADDLPAPSRWHPPGARSARRHPGADVPDRAGRLAAPVPARRRRGDGRVDVRRPPRPDPAAGRRARAARRAGTPSPRSARPAVRRSPATSSSRPWSPTDRLELAVVDVSGKGEEAGTRALLLSGAFGGLLGALPRRPVPPGRQRLPAAPGLGGGLRDRDPPLPRPRRRHLRGAHGRPPARRAPPGRHRPLGGAAQRGADPRA